MGRCICDNDDCSTNEVFTITSTNNEIFDNDLQTYQCRTRSRVTIHTSLRRRKNCIFMKDLDQSKKQKAPKR